MEAKVKGFSLEAEWKDKAEDLAMMYEEDVDLCRAEKGRARIAQALQDAYRKGQGDGIKKAAITAFELCGDEKGCPCGAFKAYEAIRQLPLGEK